MKTFDIVYDCFVDGKTQLEMLRWIKENIKHHCKIHHKCCDVYCFEDELDAIAFKLRWS